MKAALFRGPLQVAAGDGGTGCSQEQVGRLGGVGTWGPGSSMALHGPDTDFPVLLSLTPGT